MGALAMRQLDQMLERRGMRHAGSNHRETAATTVPGLHAAILGLQRTAGNQAVASLIALQRCGPTPCGCNHEEREGAQVQREEADGGDAPSAVPACHSFTSFADDFLGTAPRSPFAALTSFNFVERNGRVAVDEDKAGSWVNKRTVPVNGRPASTTKAVSDCRKGMSRKNATDWTWTPSNSCTASAAIRSPATATTRDECETVLGAQLDTDDQADMARLLNHEQYHMNLACALASLGNDQIAAGAGVKGVLKKVIAASSREQRAYDNDTGHGCNPGAQSTWESNIDGGTVKFP